MSLSLLQILEGEQEEYESAFFLTYTLNLRFFEGLVLPRLLRLGVRHVGILVDHTGYAETLREGRLQEQSACGRAYVVAPIRLPGGGIQHAKVVWLSGKDHRVLIGSHNLTMSGFNDQIELTTELHSTNPAHLTALHELSTAISEKIPQALKSTWTRIRTSTLPSANSQDTNVHVLTSLHESLEEQVARAVGPCEYLRVVTPFLDESQLRQLVEHIGAREVVLDVPREGLDIPLANALLAVPTLTARSVDDAMGRRLHAKGYEFRTGDVTWAAIGSANCTKAALASSVTAGGNLEILVLSKGVALPTDLEFEPVGDPRTFPATGRAWNEGRASGILLVTRAEYQHGELHVEWEAAGHRDIALAELLIDDHHPAVHLEASPKTLPLDSAPPDYVTLRGLIGDDVVETRAWIINRDELDQAAQRASVHRWAERISSRNPLHLANSIELWLTHFLLHQQRYAQLNEAVAGDHGGSDSTSVSMEDGDRMRDFHEVFTYSSDETRVRRVAEQMLAGSKGTDPLAIFRALFARMGNTVPEDELSTSPTVTSADSKMVQRHYAAAEREREAGQRRVVDAFIRHLKALAGDSTARATLPVAAAEERIRLTASLITLIGIEVVRRNPELGRREPFVEAGVQWAQTIIDGRPDVLSRLAVRGPLALSLAVLGDIALLTGQSWEHDAAATLARRILGSNPRTVLESWRSQCPDQADTLLTASLPERDRASRDLFVPLTLLAEQLLGAPRPYLRAQLHERWGLLMALQEADMRGAPEAESLYVQAADKYHGSAVWRRYQQLRSQRQFPVIVQARNGRCPLCGLQLSLTDNRRLNRGEPVLNACRHALLVSV